MKRVTMKEVAEKAGVHQSSVSMALRNHPRIGKATRERIKKIAEEMGYRPDPGLSALAAYRSGLRPAEERGEIALIGRRLHRTPTMSTTTGAILMGLHQQAERYGYKITPFDITDPSLSPKQVNRILNARNISGLIVMRMDLHGLNFLRGIHWDNITAVGLGRWPPYPPVTRIEHDQYNTTQQILYRMLRRGYRRIGLIHHYRNLKGISFHTEAAYLQILTRSKVAQPYPVFYLDQQPLAALTPWAKQHDLDAVISMQEPKSLFTNKKIQQAFMKSLGFACLNLHNLDGTLAGMNQQLDRIGIRAVDVLVAQINRGERGFPETVSKVLIEGRWVEGSTLPQCRKVR